MATPFDKVLTLNYAFGTLTAPEPVKTPDNDDLAKAFKLVDEEVNELIAATTRVDIADGVADTLVVIDGMLARAGYDANDVTVVIDKIKFLLKSIRRDDYAHVENVHLLILIKSYTLFVAHTLGINSMDAFNIVHDNNMSKLCPSEEDADATIQKYAEQGIITNKYRAGEFWVVRAGGPKDKFLKNHTWTPPDLSAL